MTMGATRHNLPSPPVKAAKLDIAVLGLLLAFPSAAFVQERAGLTGLSAYAAVVLVAVVACAWPCAPLRCWLDRHFILLAAAFLAGLLGCHLALHPFEDGRGPGLSSDRDEGLEIATSRLMNGENPYYPANKVAGPLSVLPGAIVLSAPFVMVGKVGLQNWFWLAALLLACVRHFRDRGGSLLLLCLPLMLSPAVQYEYISGGDLLSNAIYTALFLLLAIHCWTASRLQKRTAVIAALLLGIGLSSRANYLLLLPLFSVVVWRQAGFSRASCATAIVLVSFSVITLPFYLADPAAFTPLNSSNKLALPGATWPWTGVAILAITLLVLLALCMRLLLDTRRVQMGRFFRMCTLATVAPMVCAVIGISILKGTLDFSFMHDRYGLLYLGFALLGWGGTLMQTHAPNQKPGKLHGPVSEGPSCEE